MKVTPGISFAIPIDYAKEFLKKSEQRKQSGNLQNHRKRRFLGITMVTITPQTIEELRSKTHVPANINHGVVIYRIGKDV